MINALPVPTQPLLPLTLYDPVIGEIQNAVMQELAEVSDDWSANTWAMDGDAVAQTMAAIHSETSSILKYTN